VSYKQGRGFEWKVRNDLEENGYAVVRAAGSKGKTKIDLIALKPGQALFIQAKRDGTLPPGEWDRLVDVASWVGAIPILAVNGPHGRGVVYTLLLGRKRRGHRIQPCEPFRLDALDGADDGPDLAAAARSGTGEGPTKGATTSDALRGSQAAAPSRRWWDQRTWRHRGAP
jgi:Holliday junction resolvase